MYLHAEDRTSWRRHSNPSLPIPVKARQEYRISKMMTEKVDAPSQRPPLKYNPTVSSTVPVCHAAVASFNKFKAKANYSIKSVWNVRFLPDINLVKQHFL